MTGRTTCLSEKQSAYPALFLVVECLIPVFGAAASVLYTSKVVAVSLQHDSPGAHEEDVHPGGTGNTGGKAPVPTGGRHGSRR